DGLQQQACQEPAVGELLVVFERWDQAVQRKTVAKGRDHLGKGRGLLQAFTTQQIGLGQGQRAAAARRSQPGKVIEATMTQAFGNAAGVAETEQAPIKVIKR